MSSRVELGSVPDGAPPDTDILAQRTNYVAKVLPFAKGVVEEDGYWQEALSSLTPQQRDTLIGISVENLAAYKFGITTKERPYIIKYKDHSKIVDPQWNRYTRRLRKTGMENPEEYKSMLTNMGNLVATATKIDPFFEIPSP